MLKNKKLVIFVILIMILGVGGLYERNIVCRNNKDELGYYHTEEYAYSINEDGTISIMEYLGNEVEVNVPEKIGDATVTVIGCGCFIENEAIEKVYIPDSIEKIDGKAFSICENLKEVNGGNNVKEIGSFAFFKDYKLEKVFSLENIKVIRGGTFHYCKSLKEVILSDKLEWIGVYAFAGTQIDYNSIPDSVEIVASAAFEDTPQLDQKDEYVITGDGVLLEYPNVENVELPIGVKFVTQNKKEDKMVKKLYCPDTVWGIDFEIIVYAESEVDLFISESVTQIGQFYYYDEIEKYKERAFDGNVKCIHGIKGSYAEEYAKKYDIPFEEEEPWY